jgi:hypothetical protein
MLLYCAALTVVAFAAGALARPRIDAFRAKVRDVFIFDWTQPEPPDDPVEPERVPVGVEVVPIGGRRNGPATPRPIAPRPAAPIPAQSYGRHSAEALDAGLIHGTIAQRRPSAARNQQIAHAAINSPTQAMPIITDDDIRGGLMNQEATHG